MAFIQINKSHFFHNLDVIANHVGGKEKVAIVLKDNAYGHDLMIMAKLAREYGLTKAYVRNLKEADAIWQLFPHVSVFCDIPNSLPPIGIHIVVNSLEQISQTPISANIELKVDSGMHRNGIAPEELNQAFALIHERRLKLIGVLTHMRSGDDLSSELFWQQKNFEDIKTRCKSLCEQYRFTIPLFHSCSSPATFRLNQQEDDFVRVGIATYGYLESDPVFDLPDLKPVMSLWGERIATRTIPKGSRIGYGGVSELDRDLTISTYDIGYGDGFFRLNHNHTYTTPSGYKLLPRVSMDYLSLECAEDKVCIFDDVRPIAKLVDTITYDVLVKLHAGIPRIVV